MDKDNAVEPATPEEEGLADTAELTEEEKRHYAEMNEASEKHRDEGKVG
jgi:hypothetical protein